MNPVLGQASVLHGRRDRRPLLAGIAVSAMIHVALALTLTATHLRLPHPAVSRVPPRLIVYADPVPDPPPPVRLPPAATPVPRPAPPVAPEGAPGAPLESGPPEYIAHDVAPRLVNGPAVLAALAGRYPDDVPDGASGAAVLLWLFVDPGGHVTKLRLQSSSGYPPLDRLAADVAPTMEYSPALHRGRRVGVWIAQRILFRPPDG